MQLQHQKITLDVNDTRAFTVLNAHQGDSKTRFIDITLTDSGNTITLSSSYVATVKASINNKTKAVNTAVVNSTNNVITVELTKTMLDTPGLLNCEVILQDNQQFVTSATFTVKVAESVISDESAIVASQEFGKLLDALIEIKDIEDKADRIQTLVDNIDKLESANDIVTRLSNVESKETQLETQHKTDVQALTDKANSIVDQANTDRQNFNNSVDEINTTLDTKENVSNKVSEITHPSLDYYPNTKAVFDYVNSKLETPLSDIESLKSGKLDKTDFNSYKTSNDNAVNSKVDTTDFNAYKSATDTAIDKCVTDIANNSALISKSQINVTTYKSTSIVLNDSSDCNISGLTLYGKSTQSAEPSPDSPAEIVSAKRLRVYKKNLFDFSNCPSACGPWGKELDSDPVVDRENNIITFTTPKKAEAGVYLWHSNYNKYNEIFWGIDYTKLANKRVTLSFDVQSDIDCTMKVMFTKKTYNYVHILATKQRVTVTEVVDTSVLRKAYCFYLSNTAATVTISNIQVEVNNVATDYEKCEYQECATAHELRGVNDVTDTLTVNSDGTGYLTQNLIYERLTSGKSQSGQLWQYSATTKRFYRDDTRIKTNGGVPNLLCSHLKVADNLKDTSLDNSIGFTSDTATAPGLAVRKLDLNGDITAFKNLLDANEVYVLAPLVTPIVTELSKEEVEKILSLHTYYPNTTIISDSDCQVEYVADPKNYIDNKFNELATAIVAHESEVM